MNHKMTVHRLRSIRYLLAQLKLYRLKMIFSVLSGILKELSIILTVGVVSYMAAELVQNKSVHLKAGFTILCICVLCRGAATYLESFLSHLVAYSALVDYRVRLYDKFVTLCPNILLKNRSGQIATALMNDIERLEWFYGHTVGYMVVVAVTCMFELFVFWKQNSGLAFLFILCAAGLMVIPFFMAGKADEQGMECRFRLGEANSVTLEGVNGMNEILTLNWQERYKEKNKRYMQSLTDVQVAYAKRMGIEGSLLRCAAAVSAILINSYCMILVRNMQMSLEWYAAIGISAWIAFQPLISICSLARSFGEVFAASERVTSLMETEPEIKDTGTISYVKNLEPSIDFRHVFFQYDPCGDNVLKDVSFHVEPGEIVALVGESGAGKTTCTSLINRLWDVTDGVISLGETDIRALRLESLHEMISVVPQDVYLFHTTIRENLRLGRPDASEDEIIEAAKMACIHDFIVSLPQGYDTLTGERGVQMSGGQRQRIAIARALLKNAPILILDEAVSNLDTRTDREIQHTIRNLAHKKTILMVAHRLSTIYEADRLIVLHNGSVVQQGRHEELIKENGYYRELIESQLNW